MGVPRQDRLSTRLLRALSCVRRWIRVLWVCRASAASVVFGLVLAFLPQVHDLFLDLSSVNDGVAGDYLQVAWDGFRFALLMTVFWAWPVHATARLAVSDPAWLNSPYALRGAAFGRAQAPLFETASKYTPRLLALACYAILAFAAWRAGENLPIAPGEPLAVRARLETWGYIALLVPVGALFALYMWKRRDTLKNVLPANRQMSANPRIGLQDISDKVGRRIDETINAVLLAALLAIFAFPGSLVLAPRLWMVPLLLGLWTPLFGYLARLGYRTRAPVTLIATGLLVLAVYELGDNHVTDVNLASPPARPTLAEAIEDWRKANGCEQGDCPSPILALVSGGASRSAFFAASTLGLLLDASCPDANPTETGCAQAPQFARRLFAISSVSGGSVGASLYARAVEDGRTQGRFLAPCELEREAGNPRPPSRLYFRSTEAHGWRQCLQLLAAEDFLSPVIAGLGFRDIFSFVGRVWARWGVDRGHRIEQAFFDAYKTYAATKDAPEGLGAGFLSLGRKSEATPWRTSLVLNSTSSETGRPFAISSIAPCDTGDALTRCWLVNAYDLHSVVGPSHDIGIAIAAHDSARFPLISPAGALFQPDHKHAYTNLLDGGYFDNYGASTALGLAEALRAAGLDPFVLLITNDPTRGDPDVPLDKPPSDPAPNRSWIPALLSAPAHAALETSSARGELALTQLRRTLGRQGPPDKPGCSSGDSRDPEPCFRHVSVYPPDTNETSGQRITDRIAAISMSWWLSKPVQSYLDNQLEAPPARARAANAQLDLVVTRQARNASALDRVCDVMMQEAATCHKHISDLSSAER